MRIISKKEYDIAIERLNALIDEVGDNEEHPLYELLDTLGGLYILMKNSTIQCQSVVVLRCFSF